MSNAWGNPSISRVPPWIQLKDSVTGCMFIFEGLNVLVSIFYVRADGFQGLSKAFHNP